MTQITKEIVFHSGHMLKDDDSKCYQPHGHEYVLKCSIGGVIQTEGTEAGMVMNFGGLKEIMMEEVHNKLDHKFIIDRYDPRYEKMWLAIGPEGLVIVEYPPTAENLLNQMKLWIDNRLPEGIVITQLKLQETYTCSAEL